MIGDRLLDRWFDIWWAVRRRPAVVTVLSVFGVVAAVVVVFVVGRELLDDDPRRVPDRIWHLADACESPGEPYVDAARHRGPAPHPVAVFPALSYQVDDPSVWLPEDPARVQLVACIDRLGLVASPPEGYDECEYVGDGGIVDVQTARYRITVYELRTGRELGSEELVGELDHCPDMLTEGQRLYSLLSHDQLTLVLTPHVARNL
ncbi:MAG TPA: hypothetical protein VK611_09255 [Acidimicrobiales bacterium]|nr:hypothetical protein [Acidimicrobiales bacterium]